MEEEMRGSWRIYIPVLIVLLCTIGGCSQKKEQAAEKIPQVSLSCIGVLPVVSASDYDSEQTFGEAKQLKEGTRLLDNLLQNRFLGREDVRFVSKAKALEMEPAATDKFLSRARKAAKFVSCNGILEMTLWRYKDRIGGQYTAKEPASVAFTYRLVETNTGTTLCQGRYDEVQKSVLENLYDFSRARERGFTWVTAEELLREGVNEKLGECSYLHNGE